MFFIVAWMTLVALMALVAQMVLVDLMILTSDGPCGSCIHELWKLVLAGRLRMEKETNFAFR